MKFYHGLVNFLLTRLFVSSFVFHEMFDDVFYGVNRVDRARRRYIHCIWFIYFVCHAVLTTAATPRDGMHRGCRRFFIALDLLYVNTKVSPVIMYININIMNICHDAV